MKNKLYKWIGLSIGVIAVIGCSQPNPSNDNVVTLELSPKYVLKTNLNQSTNKIKTDKAYVGYNLGVFPFDYDPVAEKTISKADLAKLNKREYRLYNIEFDLALNNAHVTPNDISIYLDGALSSEDQVRVLLTRNVQDGIHPIKEEEIIKGNYDKELSKEIGLDCYTLSFGSYPTGKQTHTQKYCTLKNTNAELPSIAFQVLGLKNEYLMANYNLEHLGINVRWKLHKKNKDEWENIHKKVLHLVDVWNVSAVKDRN
jgi:hypothetical protein